VGRHLEDGADKHGRRGAVLEGGAEGTFVGFNNKIRWLVKQAYGYRDEEYFRLKIFDLPNIKIKKEL